MLRYECAGYEQAKVSWSGIQGVILSPLFFLGGFESDRLRRTSLSGPEVMHSYLIFHWLNPDVIVLTVLEFTRCLKCESDAESESRVWHILFDLQRLCSVQKVISKYVTQ